VRAHSLLFLAIVQVLDREETLPPKSELGCGVGMGGGREEEPKKILLGQKTSSSHLTMIAWKVSCGTREFVVIFFFF
jgi:hypothetical protein